WSLALEPGTGAWHRSLAPEPGTGAWHWSLALEPGTGAWHRSLAPERSGRGLQAGVFRFCGGEDRQSGIGVLEFDEELIVGVAAVFDLPQLRQRPSVEERRHRPQPCDGQRAVIDDLFEARGGDLGAAAVEVRHAGNEQRGHIAVAFGRWHGVDGGAVA